MATYQSTIINGLQNPTTKEKARSFLAIGDGGGIPHVSHTYMPHQEWQNPLPVFSMGAGHCWILLIVRGIKFCTPKNLAPGVMAPYAMAEKHEWKIYP